MSTLRVPACAAHRLPAGQRRPASYMRRLRRARLDGTGNWASPNSLLLEPVYLGQSACSARVLPRIGAIADDGLVSLAAMWECERCGRAFANRNQVHTCALLASLDDHFAGEASEVRAAFDRVVAAVSALGPVEVLPEKTSSGAVATQCRAYFPAQLARRRRRRVRQLAGRGLPGRLPAAPQPLSPTHQERHSGRPRLPDTDPICGIEPQFVGGADIKRAVELVEVPRDLVAAELAGGMRVDGEQPGDFLVPGLSLPGTSP
jgi:hypothetical protein